MPGRRPSPEVRRKRGKLLEYCRAGVDHDAIAVELGYKNGDVVRAIYWEELNKLKTVPAEQGRLQHLDRLEAIFQGVYPEARKGRDKAVGNAVKVLERIAKLEGYDHADQMNERKVELAEDTIDVAALAMTKVLDAIGLTPEQELIKANVIKEQLALLTGTAFISLHSLIEEQESKNEEAVRALALTVGGEE